MANATSAHKQSNAAFYTFMGIMLAGFAAIVGFIIYLMVQ